MYIHVCACAGGAGGGVVDLTNDSGVEDELVDLTSPVSSSVNLCMCVCLTVAIFALCMYILPLPQRLLV